MSKKKRLKFLESDIYCPNFAKTIPIIGSLTSDFQLG